MNFLMSAKTIYEFKKRRIRYIVERKVNHYSLVGLCFIINHYSFKSGRRPTNSERVHARVPYDGLSINNSAIPTRNSKV